MRSSARVSVPEPHPNSRIVSPGSRCSMCRAVQARHQTRIPIRLSLWVQYQLETRSRWAIDSIVDAEIAFNPTGGSASGFVGSIGVIPPERRASRGPGASPLAGHDVLEKAPAPDRAEADSVDPRREPGRAGGDH